MNKEFYTTQKMKFSIKDFLSKWEKPRDLFYVGAKYERNFYSCSNTAWWI